MPFPFKRNRHQLSNKNTDCDSLEGALDLLAEHTNTPMSQILVWSIYIDITSKRFLIERGP